ncbi:testis-expressed protein 264-like isoform X2 [Tigriopus californicus]|uniref:testis-expressed protein 264-like isoform X2 n=1 Tax=Tigriopus californicus TaxID=6832 RepID=UPI0027D9FD77|nr:testis-expressed protein 264-like isoform X2 [Tigriopus californicus]
MQVRYPYAVGCILSQEPAAASTEDMERMIAQGFHLVHLPKPNYCVWTSFPFRTTLSIFIGIFRVYPKLKDYITSRGLCAYPAVEVYDGDQINFMMPLSRQEEFFVPEFSEEEVSIATTEASSATQAGLSRSSRVKTASNSSRKVMTSLMEDEVTVAETEVDEDGFLKPISIKKVDKTALPEDPIEEDLEEPSSSSKVDEDSSEFEDLTNETLEPLVSSPVQVN